MKKIVFAALTMLFVSHFASATSPGWAHSSRLYLATAHGYEADRVLYICHASAHGGMHPGKVVAGQCNIGYGGREETYSDFEVYIGRGHWANPREGYGFYSPVVGGWEPGRRLGICLASAHGGMHPGKIVAGQCNIGYGGLEEVHSTFKILVD